MPIVSLAVRVGTNAVGDWQRPDSAGTWGTTGGWWGTVELGDIADRCNGWGAIGGWLGTAEWSKK